MDKIFLVHPNARYAADIKAYRKAFIERGDSIDGTGGLADYEDPNAYLEYVRQLGDPGQLPPGRVLSTQFMALRASDGKILGMLQIRHSLNEYLAHFSGHIGYSVFPDERRRGIAKWLLRQALYYCRDVLHLENVSLSCSSNNYASARVIQFNGGTFFGAEVNPGDGREMKKFRFDTRRLTGQALPWVFPPEAVPMRRSRQQMSEAETEILLKEEKAGCLALGAGYPYVIPMNFVYSEEKRLYFHTAKAGDKLKRMEEDPRACFTVFKSTDRPEIYTSVFRSVQVCGRLRRISKEEEIRRSLLALCRKHNPGALAGIEEKTVEDGMGRVQILELLCEKISGKKASELL